MAEGPSDHLGFLLGGGEMGRLIAAHDWSATPLGPIESWPTNLRTSVGICLASRHPMVIWWGQDLVLLYNDAWVPILGPSKHPAVGRPGAEVWPEMWHIIGAQLRGVLESGEATWSDDQLLPADRFGYLEEAYFTYSYSPIRDGSERVDGVFTAVTETTARVVAQRRLGTLRAFGAVSAAAGSTAEQLCVAAVEVLARNRADVPASLVYLRTDDGTAARLVAGHGVAPERFPQVISEQVESDSAWAVLVSGRSVVTGSLTTLRAGAFAGGTGVVSDQAPDHAVVLPLAGAGTRGRQGVIVLGVSPHLELDADYRTFLDLVADQLSRALADARSYQAQERRVEELAELDRARTTFALDNALLLAEEATTARRLAQLQAATSELSAAATPTDVVTVAVRCTAALLDTRTVVVWEVTPDGSLQTLDPGWPSDAARSVCGRIEPDAPVPSADAARRGESIWLSDAADWRRHYPHLQAQVEPYGFPGTGIVPLMVGGRCVGVLVATFASARVVGPAERAAAVAIAEQCAQALERARLHAAEHDARAASEAAAARLETLVSGLAAIVWEAGWDPAASTPAFTFVSRRAQELLGHPVQRWLDDPGFWPSIIDVADRDRAVAERAQGTAAGRDHASSYRARTQDGRVVWLQDVVHVVCDAAGTPIRLQGVMIDITEGKRTERAAALLAEAGRVLAVDGSVDERLNGLLRITAIDLGGYGVASLLLDGGGLRHVVAAPEYPEREALLALAPTDRVSPQAMEVFRGGVPVVTEVDPTHRPASRTEEQNRAVRALDTRRVLVVPLTTGGRILGFLTFATPDPARSYDDTDIELARELGGRAAAAIHAHRLQERAGQLQAVTTALAAAATLADVAQALAAGAADALDAVRVTVYRVSADGRPERLHVQSYGEVFPVPGLDLDAPMPVVDCVRTGEPVWLQDADAWQQAYPQLVGLVEGTSDHGAAVLPMRVAGRVTGAIGIGFDGPKALALDQRAFAISLATQAAQAFERAAAADERREVAETLQRSLLPARPPDLERLILAQRYLPGASSAQAGGDWFDVLVLGTGTGTGTGSGSGTNSDTGSDTGGDGDGDADVDDPRGTRVAIAVGDVVGQGAPAAAVMGQLRSALSGYLLEGHPPGRALDLLDRFARRVHGAVASSAICVVLDVGTGELTWAVAGHPPPLVLDGTGARFLAGATGRVLGIGGEHRETRTRIAPGATLALYTDGLVERRGEVVDDGLARLAAAVTGLHELGPDELAAALIERTLDTAGPVDDVALVLARLVPPPLHDRLPADPVVLTGLRRTVARWASAAAVTGEFVEDLQLALGEAAANAVEHAYPPGSGGEFDYSVARCADGGVRVSVRDGGRWRPPDLDPGHRGRGLAMIRRLAVEVTIDGDDDGTEVRFRLPPSALPPSALPPSALAPSVLAPPSAPLEVAHPPGPARLVVSSAPPRRCVEVHGDLDLAGVQAIEAELLREAAGPDDLTVDLTHVGYVGSAGVGVLAQLAQHTVGRVELVAPDGSRARRVLALAGLDALLTVRGATTVVSPG